VRFCQLVGKSADPAVALAAVADELDAALGELQTEQAWCLTLVTNAVVAWTTTEYYGLAVESMRAAGRQVDDEVLAHISPAHSENINFFGAIDVDIDGELAALDPSGYRPLRVRDTLF
jgi:hypothetical protein